MSFFPTKNWLQDLPKILTELQGLNVSGPIAGATGGTQIAVPGMETEDTILNITDITTPAAVDLTHVTITERRAKGTLTVGTVADGDTIIVNGITYTFKDLVESIAFNALPRTIPFQSDPSGANDTTKTAARLAQVIMSADPTLTAVSALAVVTVFNRTAGTAGNSKTLSVAGSNSHVTRSGANLAGGTATQGFACSDSTSGKNLMVYWYNKQ